MLRRNKKNIQCKLKPLSLVINENKIKKIDLLKIDCEGNELKVLNGISDVNWGIIKQLIVEVHDINGRLDIVKNILNSRGYKIDIFKEQSLKETNLFNVVAIK